MGGGGGKGGSATIGYRYYMSLHMGLTRGPVDEIVQIDVGDLRAWPVPDGQQGGLKHIAQGPGGGGIAAYEDGRAIPTSAGAINTIGGSGGYSINAPDLFGGDKKEGGIQGSLTVMMGHPTQVVASWIKSLMGGRVPDFRGVCTMMFDGLISSLNPYPKAWSVRLRRTVSGWDGPVWQPSLATIWLRDGTIKAMNPAHIIYECLTNRDWGRGFSRNLLNDTKNLQTAQTLYDEKLGLCLRWNRQAELGSFIQEVIDHMGGSMYVDRSTGLITFDLLRGDYDYDTLPTFTYDSGLISIEEDDTATQEDVRNEVIINWVDPIENADRQARIHNLASLQSLGAVNSSTTSYAGAPTVELALRLGQRDLKAGANSLNRYKVKLDRRAWRIIPGSVFKISAPDKNIFNIIVRAGKITEVGGTDGSLSVDAVLDVFGLPAASFISAPPEEWTPPDRSAAVATRRHVREATYADLVRRFSQADLDLITDTQGALATMAAKPTPLTQAYSNTTRATGEEFVERAASSFVPLVVTASAVSIYQTVIPFTGGIDLGLVVIGGAVQIGSEICRLDDIDTDDGVTGTITIARGCLDTLPATHAADTPIFLYNFSVGTDGREYELGETVDVKLITSSSTNKLEIDLAPTDTLLIRARQARPWPPADMRVNTTPYASVGTITGLVTLSWAHRDRKIVRDQLVEHAGGSVGPEAGTTYTVRVYNGLAATSPSRTVPGITGTSFDYTTAMRVADGMGLVVVFEVEAVRDGMVSQFGYRFPVSVTAVPVEELVVQVSNPGGFAFTSGGFTRFPFYTETLDSEGAFNSNDRYLVPSTATYRFTLDVALAGAATEMVVGSLWDLKIDNFTAPTTGVITGQSASGTYDGSTPIQLVAEIALTAGDVVSAYMRHDSPPHVTVASAVLKIHRLP